MTFKDHFSGHAAEYARFRPRYPEPLFAYLAEISPARDAAWDCATGNGQAAVMLAAQFAKVIATDASEQQIASAELCDNVDYRVAPAEASGIASRSIDVVTVAQALHWFDIPAFFAEATRVLKPRGAIAVWAYNLLTVSPEIDALVHEFYSETTGPYWPPERVIVEAGYRGVDFPFEPIAPPDFAMESSWTADQLFGYLRTWSATKRFIADRGFDPVDALADKVRPLWTDGTRVVHWPVMMRVGRVPA